MSNLSFKKRILQIEGYRDANFFNLKSIGVIARGPSNLSIKKIYKNFEHCFLAGEFNNNLRFFDKFFKNKSIVLSTIQPKRYRTSEALCKEFNIKNIQISHQYGTPKYNEIKEHYFDLKVVGYSGDQAKIAQKIFKKEKDGKKDNIVEYKINSTGIAAVFQAAYFDPKEVFIAGIDFYNTNFSKYLMDEEHDDPTDSVVNSAMNLRQGMIEDFYSICDFYPNIIFNIYTTFRELESKKNVNIYYV